MRSRPAGLNSFAGIVAAVVVDVAVIVTFLAATATPISLPVVAAILTIVGYSVNDSVVLLSHIGQRTPAGRSPLEIVTVTVDEILSRTLLTSLSTMIPALAILAVGLTPLVDFAQVMLVGVVSGTASSLFVVGSFAVRGTAVALGAEELQLSEPSAGPTRSESR